MSTRLLAPGLALLGAAVAAAGGCAATPMAVTGACERVRGMPGPEDLELDGSPPAGPRLLVSSLDRRRAGAQGAIYTVSIVGGALGHPRAMPLAGRDSVPFSPHGLSLVSAAAPPRLYVVNHISACCHAVEIFDVEAERLVFRDRLMHPLLDSPNDLVALPDGQVYVTNMGWSRGVLGLVGVLLSFRRGTVAHYKDGSWTVAADDIAYANGIAVAPAGDRLYVAGMRDHGIHVFPRDPRTGALGAREAIIAVGSNVDNLAWAREDRLLVAAHPSLLAFARHTRDARHASPSEVYAVDTRGLRSTRVYADAGTEISAASTGLLVNGRLYLGQVFDDAVVSCAVGPLP